VETEGAQPVLGDLGRVEELSRVDNLREEVTQTLGLCKHLLEVGVLLDDPSVLDVDECVVDQLLEV